jgi:pyruvate carboxylase
MAKELEQRGAHILAIKDMAGLCKPYAAFKLVKALKEATGLPVHFHTHDTSGVNAASILKAAEADVDVADAAIASFSGTTSQPNLNSIVAALANTERDTGLDLHKLNACSDYFEAVRSHYQAFDAAPPAGTAEVYLHEMPGGQYTNLKAQAGSMGLGGRWPEVARAYADVNLAFGDIVKVTPSSKVVGDMALFLVSHGLTMKAFMANQEHHALHLPNSVIDMFMGSLGEPEGGWPPAIQKIVLKGAEPRHGRPGAMLEPADLATSRRDLEAKVGHSLTEADVLSYLMYPAVFLQFDESRQACGDLSILPTPHFFYGMQKGEEISVDLEPGKTLVIKFLTASEPHADGSRTLYFELNGQPRDVRNEVQVQPKADPAVPGEVGAPIPGIISSIAVEPLQVIRKGDRLLVMEAMKMQTNLYAPMDGKVAKLCTHNGQRVEAKDLLLVIE